MFCQKVSGGFNMVEITVSLGVFALLGLQGVWLVSGKLDSSLLNADVEYVNQIVSLIDQCYFDPYDSCHGTKATPVNVSRYINNLINQQKKYEGQGYKHKVRDLERGSFQFCKVNDRPLDDAKSKIYFDYKPPGVVNDAYLAKLRDRLTVSYGSGYIQEYKGSCNGSGTMSWVRIFWSNKKIKSLEIASENIPTDLNSSHIRFINTEFNSQDSIGLNDWVGLVNIGTLQVKTLYVPRLFLPSNWRKYDLKSTLDGNDVSRKVVGTFNYGLGGASVTHKSVEFIQGLLDKNCGSGYAYIDSGLHCLSDVTAGSDLEKKRGPLPVNSVFYVPPQVKEFFTAVSPANKYRDTHQPAENHFGMHWHPILISRGLLLRSDDTSAVQFNNQWNQGVYNLHLKKQELLKETKALKARAPVSARNRLRSRYWKLTEGLHENHPFYFRDPYFNVFNIALTCKSSSGNGRFVKTEGSFHDNYFQHRSYGSVFNVSWNGWQSHTINKRDRKLNLSFNYNTYGVWHVHGLGFAHDFVNLDTGGGLDRDGNPGVTAGYIYDYDVGSVNWLPLLGGLNFVTSSDFSVLRTSRSGKFFDPHYCRDVDSMTPSQTIYNTDVLTVHKLKLLNNGVDDSMNVWGKPEWSKRFSRSDSDYRRNVIRSPLNALYDWPEPVGHPYPYEYLSNKKNY